MTSSPNGPAPRPGGSSAVGPKPTRRKWLLPLLIGLAVLIILFLLLSRCGNDDDTAASSPATPTAAVATSAVVPSAVAPASQPDPAASTDQGTVVADDSVLLGGAAGMVPLSDHDGAQAVGHAVAVQSVPADEGFWVGTSATDRLWVQLTGTHGESDYRVKQGDAIDFTGTVKSAAEGFAAKVGMTAAEGSGQLTEQGAYLSVRASDVKLFQ